MEQGGDLVTAFFQGPLTAKIYTHQLGVGATKPSFFVTIEGAKTILDALPNQDDSVKQRLLTLLHDHLLDQVKATSCFQPASDDPMMVDEDDDFGASSSSAMTPFNMYHIFAAENRALVAQLKAKDDVMKAKSSESEAFIAKERAEKMAAVADECAKKQVALANKDLEHALDSAAKDAKIVELQHIIDSTAKDARIKELERMLKRRHNVQASMAGNSENSEQNEEDIVDNEYGHSPELEVIPLIPDAVPTPLTERISRRNT